MPSHNLFSITISRDLCMPKCKHIDLFIDCILSWCLFRFLKIITFSPGKNGSITISFWTFKLFPYRKPLVENVQGQRL